MTTSSSFLLAVQCGHLRRFIFRTFRNRAQTNNSNLKLKYGSQKNVKQKRNNAFAFETSGLNFYFVRSNLIFGRQVSIDSSSLSVTAHILNIRTL